MWRALALVCLTTAAAAQEIKSFEPRGYEIKGEVDLPVDANTAFDLATGDIRPWWDHSFSRSPEALVIEAKPGGRFYETFDKEGNGCTHAEVIYVERGKTIRMEGPLGLSGRAVQMVTTWEFAPNASEGSAAESTRLKYTVNVCGQLDDELGKSVAGVWRHFLNDRLKSYVESGKWKKS